MSAGSGIRHEGYNVGTQTPLITRQLTDILTGGDTAAVFGFASGTFKGIRMDKNENFWKFPVS